MRQDLLESRDMHVISHLSETARYQASAVDDRSRVGTVSQAADRDPSLARSERDGGGDWCNAVTVCGMVEL